MSCMVKKKDDGRPAKRKKGEVETVQPNMECPHVQSLVSDVAAEVKKKVLRKLKKGAASP
jgi:hypothetical protein